jgi:peptidoglycan/LPS O-acetylase OafA/YrhL
MKSAARVEWLDLFRGLAAVAVVIYHYRDFLHIRPGFYGFLAVDVFFVLSGIVLGLRYTAAIEQGLGFREFAAARLHRLYPMVLIAGALICAVTAAIAPEGRVLKSFDRHVWSFFILWPSWSPLSSAAFPADPPAWSLWAELAANVIWFFVIRGGRRWMLWLGLATMAATLVIAWDLNSMDFGASAGYGSRVTGLVRAFAWFSVGYAISQGTFRRHFAPARLTLACVVITAVAAATLRQPWLNQFLVVATCASVLQVLFFGRPPPAAIAGFGRLLGLASYPLYLIHMPAKPLLKFAGECPHWLAMVVLLVCVAVLATWLNETIVKRLQRIQKRSRVVISQSGSILA